MNHSLGDCVDIGRRTSRVTATYRVPCYLEHQFTGNSEANPGTTRLTTAQPQFD
jgi:hypothetical protein